jgi:hypothetical protein
MGRIPDVRHQPGFRRINAERDRQIVKDYVFFRQREVMHHRSAGNGNVRYAAHFSGFVDDDVLDIILTGIRDDMNLTAPYVGFGMRGEAGGQLAAEIVGPNRVQFVGNFVREGTAFNRREYPAGMSEDTSVGGLVAVMNGASRPRFA